MYKKLVNTMSLVLLLSLISMVTSPVMVYPTVADSNYGLEVFAQGPRGLFGMAFDKEGNLYVAHEGYIDAPAGTDILKITPKGEVTTYATGFTGPSGLAFDRKGNLWVSDDRGPNGIHRINPDGSITTFTFYPLINPNAIAFDKDWNLFVADAGTGCIYKIPPPYNDNEIITFAVGFSTPESVDIDKSGNVYTSDMLGKIYKIDPSGSVVVFAEGLGWTNGGLVLDKMGNVYASFPPNVLVFTPDGVGKVFVTGFTSYPRGLVFDVEGRLYITDCNAGIIWRFTPSKIVFNSRVVGECWIAYGGIGPGIPSPIEWSGLGMGDARIRGSAEAVVPYKISGYPSIQAYVSEDVEATGCISLIWTEDSSVHQFDAVFYSTEYAAVGMFIPNEDHFAVPIPGVTLRLEKALSFTGLLVSDSEHKTISGLGLFTSGIYGPPPFPDVIIVLLLDPGDDGVYFSADDTLYMMIWSREPRTVFGAKISAAKVFKSEVEFAGAPAKPTIIDLGTLGGTFSQALAINDRGQIVGTSTIASGEQHAFIWTETGGMKDLGTLPGGTRSAAWAINNLGQIVGWSTIASGEQHACLWTETGDIVDLGTLGGTFSYAFDINDWSQIVGSSTITSGEFHAFLWTEKDGMKDLGTLGGQESYARGINNRGQVVGYAETASDELHAFLWTEKDGMKDLGTLPDGTFSVAWAINDRGQIVGSSGIASGEQHAFLWTKTGGMKDLGTLGGPHSSARAISDRGQIVGMSYITLSEYHAYLWRETGGMTDLGTLPGGTLSFALNINNLGQVVGWSTTASGQRHAVLWTT